MKESFYYLNLDTKIVGEENKGDRFSLKRELVLNCAGCIDTQHIHKFKNTVGRKDYYLIYVTKGALYFNSCGKETYLKPFEAIILPPNTPYMQGLDTSDELNYLWAHFTGKGVEDVLSQFGINKYPFVNTVSQGNHLQTRFQRLFDCFVKNDEFIERDLSASLEKLMIELARAKKENNKPRISLSKSLSYINDHYNTKIKIPDLAKMDGLSMTQYNLHFKNQTGMSPTQYITTLRMNLAKDLIESSNLSLVQIAIMCGYEDYNFFAKVFKKLTGLSPKSFRNQ